MALKRCDCGRELVGKECPVCDGSLARPAWRAANLRQKQRKREKEGTQFQLPLKARAALGAKVAEFDPVFKKEREAAIMRSRRGKRSR